MPGAYFAFLALNPISLIANPWDKLLSTADEVIE